MLHPFASTAVRADQTPSQVGSFRRPCRGQRVARRSSGIGEESVRRSSDRETCRAPGPKESDSRPLKSRRSSLVTAARCDRRKASRPRRACLVVKEPVLRSGGREGLNSSGILLVEVRDRLRALPRGLVQDPSIRIGSVILTAVARLVARIASRSTPCALAVVPAQTVASRHTASICAVRQSSIECVNYTRHPVLSH